MKVGTRHESYFAHSFSAMKLSNTSRNARFGISCCSSSGSLVTGSKCPENMIVRIWLRKYTYTPRLRIQYLTKNCSPSNKLSNFGQKNMSKKIRYDHDRISQYIAKVSAWIWYSLAFWMEMRNRVWICQSYPKINIFLYPICVEFRNQRVAQKKWKIGQHEIFCLSWSNFWLFLKCKIQNLRP